MDLSTTSLWAATAEQRSFTKLEADRSADVVVIGGGVAGVTAALLLQKAGKQVVLLEARELGSGVTKRSTAHLTEALDTRYFRIESAFGADGAKLVARSSRDAIERIAQLSEAHAKDAGLRRRPGYLYTEDEAAVERELRRELDAARRAGLAVEWSAKAPLPFENHGAVVFPNQAQIHIGKYLAGLADAARAAGVAIHEQSRVLTIEDGEPCTVHLEHGPTVTAAKVFVATHAPLNRVFLQTKIHAYRSYVQAFAAPALADGLFWDTEDPYHYFSRFEVDGDDYLIVGGEDHKTGTESETEGRGENLRTWSREHFGTDRTIFEWSAQVEEPIDGLPYIGRNSASENVYVATGFSGNGITLGTVSAEIVTDLVLGRENPYAELFAATRIKAIGAAATYASENIDFPMHFVSDRLHPVEAGSVDDIKPGEGKTVRVHGRRLAAYRDTDGRIHAVSSVCTHLGCLVKFNPAETSWDCPCHGSRFDVDGGVLDGPATSPLRKREV